MRLHILYLFIYSLLLKFTYTFRKSNQAVLVHDKVSYNLRLTEPALGVGALQSGASEGPAPDGGRHVLSASVVPASKRLAILFAQVPASP